MYRGLIHFHSEYSYDSFLSIKRIVNFAIQKNINFLILTDHETIEGSLALRDYISKNNYNIEVIIAAEYNTSYGDIIALNIHKEIENMEFNHFIEEIRKQNGLVLFPHPYKGHINIEYIASQADLIEVFNSRCDDISNKKAFKLAHDFKKQAYYSTDAHNCNSLGNSIIEFKKNGTFIESLQYEKIIQITCKKTYNIEVVFSQLTKSFKHRNIKLFIVIFIGLIQNIIKLKIMKKI